MEARSAARTATGWVGWVWFGGIMLLVVGALQWLQGLLALIEDQLAVMIGDQLLIVDLTTWAWVHLAVGLVLVVAGIGVFAGALWARMIAVVVAVISILLQLLALPVYPMWAVVVILLDIVVIYALVVHGAEVQSV